MLRRLAFAAVAVALLLGLAEVVLAVAGWPPPVDPSRFAHRKVFWITEPDLDRAPFEHREEGRVFHVSTDANGLRARGHPIEPPPGTFRIMAMGCSTTFGWGVEDDQTWPARLEAIAHAAGHPEVEVINAGQPGYTTLQGRWLWEEVGRDYRPDLVILGFVVQDARKAPTTDRMQALLTGEHRLLRERLLYRWRLYRGLVQLLEPLRAPGRQGAKEAVYRVPPEEYLENLRAMSRSIRASGARPVFFGMPLEREGYTALHRRVLRLEAERAGIPHFDPSDRIADLSRRETLYFPHDRGHPNARGCDVIARMVWTFLVDSGLVPGTGG